MLILFKDWSDLAIAAAAIYKVNAIRIKASITFFTEIEQIIPKFAWNYKRSQIVKAVLRRKIKAGGNTFLGFKVYYKYILIRVGTNGHLGQWNTI